MLELERSKIHTDLVERFSRGSRPLSELFEEALGQREPFNSQDKLTDEEARIVLQKIFDLCTRVTATDRDRCSRDLDRLLDTCYRFRGSRSFKSFLKTVHSRRPLVQIIEKLGRYKTASNSLVAAARKFPNLFSNVEVEAVPQLPILDAKTAAGYRGIYIADVAQDLTHNTEHMCMSRLRTVTDLDNAKLESKYQELCQAAPTAHAEIQLVKFYEENADIDRPAFIGCSKKACYLCGLFLELQGHFTVSKVHQNIYHNWAVPTIRCANPDNAAMLDHFVEKMNHIIEDSCKKMLWENPKPEDHDLHGTMLASPPMSPGFPSPRTPLTPLSPTFPRSGAAASSIYCNLQNIRTAMPPLSRVSSKSTDSSSDSTSPHSRSPVLSSASSRTSVSDTASVAESPVAKPRQQRRKPFSAATKPPPQVKEVDIPPRAVSRQAKEPPIRPGSRSLVKRGRPVEVPKVQPGAPAADLPVSSFTRSQSVRGTRKAAPSPARNLPTRSPSALAKAPEIPARATGRPRASSVMSARRPLPTSPESVSPLTQSLATPLALRRTSTAPVEASAKSAIPVPRSISRSSRKVTPVQEPVFGSSPRSPSSNIRSVRKPSPVCGSGDSDLSSPTHITRSLRRSSPISVARFETAITMAMTTITGSPNLVELPKPVEAPSVTPKVDVVALLKAHDEASAPVKTVETVPDAAAIKRDEPLRIDTSVATLSRQSSPAMEDLTRTESTEVQAALSPRELPMETDEQPAPVPAPVPAPAKRSLSERRGRPLKRVDSSSTASSVTRPPRSSNEERKAAIARASAAAIEESGLAAQRKRGVSGLPLRGREQSNIPMSLPKNYYSDTEALKMSLRGGALTRSRPRSRLPKMQTNPSETEYTLYLAGPNHDDSKGLGEKLFVGKLSDGHTGGELKQRVGCRLRTQLRPAEKEIQGMRVKEVAKSLEEMVLDIFFPDAVLRLEVMWDGVV